MFTHSDTNSKWTCGAFNLTKPVTSWHRFTTVGLWIEWSSTPSLPPGKAPGRPRPSAEDDTCCSLLSRRLCSTWERCTCCTWPGYSYPAGTGGRCPISKCLKPRELFRLCKWQSFHHPTEKEIDFDHYLSFTSSQGGTWCIHRNKYIYIF